MYSTYCLYKSCDINQIASHQQPPANTERQDVLHYYRKHEITLLSSLPIALNSSKLHTAMLSSGII